MLLLRRLPLAAALFGLTINGVSCQTCADDSGFVQNKETFGWINFIQVDFGDDSCLTRPSTIALTIEPSPTDETTLSTKPAGILKGVLNRPDCLVTGPCTLKFQYENVKSGTEITEAGAVLRIAKQGVNADSLMGITIPELTEGSQVQVNEGFSNLQKLDIWGKNNRIRLASTLQPEDDSTTLQLDIELHKPASGTSLTISSASAPGGVSVLRMDSNNNEFNIKYNKPQFRDGVVRVDLTSFNTVLVESNGRTRIDVGGRDNSIKLNGVNCSEPNVVFRNQTGNECQETDDTVEQDPFPCSMPAELITSAGEDCKTPSAGYQLSLKIHLVVTLLLTVAVL